jgi:adenine-specific DNA-methyltransferase
VPEPSFGGCGFIAAVYKHLIRLGNEQPLTNIYGCDLDVRAFKKHLPNTIGETFDQRHFRKMDFLSVGSDTFDVGRFDAVIGNPPYVSYHNMFKRQRIAASRIGSNGQFRVSRMASLWAYFVFHSLRLIKRKGRMAWLLPGSLLHADYAKGLLHELARHFSRVAVISLGERIFVDDDVSETTEILLCDGYDYACFRGQVEVAHAQNIDGCVKLLNGWLTNEWSGTALNGRAIPALLGGKKLSTFEKISAGDDVTKLGELANISIGIVTGSNRLFVLSEDTALKHRLPLTGECR